MLTPVFWGPIFGNIGSHESSRLRLAMMHLKQHRDAVDTKNGHASDHGNAHQAKAEKRGDNSCH